MSGSAERSKTWSASDSRERPSVTSNGYDGGWLDRVWDRDASAKIDPYGTRVLSASPVYWRLGESSGTTAADCRLAEYNYDGCGSVSSVVTTIELVQ
jgi:hypothetical protein